MIEDRSSYHTALNSDRWHSSITDPSDLRIVGTCDIVFLFTEYVTSHVIHSFFSSGRMD